MKKIVLIFTSPVLPTFIEKYSLNELAELGNEVILVDLTPVLEPEIDKLLQQSRISDKNYTYMRFSKRKEIERFFRDFSKKAFFFPMFNDYYEVRYVYQLLTKYQVCYGHVNHLEGDVGIGNISKFPSLNKDTFRFEHLKRAFYNRILRKIVHHKKADFISLGSRTNINGCLYLCNCGKNTRHIYLHTFDYERYLNSEKYNNNGVEYCVFIDQYLPYHPDCIIQQGWTINAKQYFEEINTFLDVIREQYKLETIVAAHPRADYSEKRYTYHNCKIQYGMSAALIKNAKLVLTHTSTAIGLAVMAHKPIIIIDNPAIAYIDGIHNWCKKYADTLKLQMWSDIKDINESLMYNIDNVAYSEYMQKYVAAGEIDNDEEQKCLWEKIVAQILQD